MNDSESGAWPASAELPSPWAELATPAGRALIASFCPWDEATGLARIERARREPAWVDQPGVVAAAATQAQLRTRAQQRFPGAPRWWTAGGLEQATRPQVAARHAHRFRAAGLTAVADLGCGVGSDSLALAQAGLRVLAVDRDADALAALQLTAHGLGVAERVTTRQADFTAMAAQIDPRWGVFCDPARRAETGRRMHPEAWSPRWSWVVALAAQHPQLGAKVAPGIPHEMLPTAAQTEWTSVDATLVEAAVWWGDLRLCHRPGARRIATVLRSRHPAQASQPAPGLDDAAGIPTLPVAAPGEWLLEPDPAVIRAGLIGVLGEQLGASLLDPHIAYLTGAGTPPTSALATSYAVLAEAPFATKALRRWLTARGIGNVVIKKRGLAVDPIELRHRLHLGGDGPTATLVLTRTQRGPLALLVDPLDRAC